MAASMLTSRMASLVISPLKPHNRPVKRATTTGTRASVSVAPRPSKFSNMNLQIKRVGYSYVNNEPILFSKVPLLLQPLAGRVCPFTGKKSNRANKVSHSKHRTKKLQKVNIQTKRVWWEAGKRMVRLKLSTKALKTISKKGLDTMAKEAGIDLRKL